MKPDPVWLLERCLPIMGKAGEIVRKAWEKPDVVHHKARTDLVTETDLSVQAFLQKELQALLPEAAFIGEESLGGGGTLANPQKELCWIVDPVDGTTNFVHRIPFMACSAALWENGRPLLGLVSAPMLDELYYAAAGSGAFLNGHGIKVSAAGKMEDSLVCTGLPYSPDLEMDGIIGRLERVIPAAQGLRRLGAAALDLAYVACGRLDAFYETSLKPWDVAAGALLVTEAGGIVSNFQGGDYVFGQPILADNGNIHSMMLNLLSLPGERE